MPYLDNGMRPNLLYGKADEAWNPIQNVPGWIGVSEETPVPLEGASEFLLYQTEGGETRVQVRLFDGTVWLPQRLIADLYQRSVKTINGHIKNIYEEGELHPQATIRKFRIVQLEGDRQVERLVDFYNLDVILAVGYRVRSHQGTRFRQWATKQLAEYVVKGFVLDDERLKESGGIGRDYFDELLERIREIRASERRFYQKITDIYATSVDYDPKHPLTLEFFKTVQNKLHWAIHGPVGALRFIRSYSHGSGDYTGERRAWLERDLDTVVAGIVGRREMGNSL